MNLNKYLKKKQQKINKNKKGYRWTINSEIKKQPHQQQRKPSEENYRINFYWYVLFAINFCRRFRIIFICHFLSIFILSLQHPFFLLLLLIALVSYYC